MEENVKLDDYIVVQRQSLVKIHKLSPKNLECRLGQDTIDLSSVLGEPYWSTYKMETKARAKRVYKLTKCVTADTFSEKILSSIASGTDNRDINDDGSSQKLSTDEIINLRKSGVSAETIVGTIVENSLTFSSKTEYSQEKYLKKKEKKYLENIVIKRPTFRIIAECILGKGTGKALGLRIDTLAQLTTLACIRSGGCYMMYETGCQGLVSAALLNAMGGDGTIIHVHAGNTPEKQAVLFMNLPPGSTDQMLCVSIHHLLRKTTSATTEADTKQVEMKEEAVSEANGKVEEGKRKAEDSVGQPEKKKPRWEEREEKAIEEVQKRNIDGLVVVGKEHPGEVLRSLLRFLHPSRPFVAFCNAREPLQQVFLELKSRADVTALRLTESWLRTYQVLPDRTHPDISMSGSGGFLLSGIKVAP